MSSTATATATATAEKGSVAGEVLGETADGTVVARGEQGRKVYTSKDGTVTVQGPDGETESVRRPDGTLLENLPKGVVKQTAPDGQVNIHFTTTNVRVQINGTVKITHMPGCVMQEDSSIGYRAMRFPDGYELIEMENGTSIDLSPDGESKVSKSDGTVIETFADKSKRVTQPDGTIRTVPPPPEDIDIA